MRHWPVPVVMAALLACALLLGTAAQLLGPRGIPWIQDHSTNPLVMAQLADIEIVDIDKARDIQESGDFLLLDARRIEDFNAGHIPTAISFPNTAREEALNELAVLLQPEQPLLVYCSGPECDEALLLGIFLRDQGTQKVVLFAGGFSQWKHAGLPVE